VQIAQTLSLDRYLRRKLDGEHTLKKYSIHFFVNLTLTEERFGYFMEDDATPHTAKETIRTLRSVFGEFNG
jgi:hypothetical protein